MVCFLRKVRYHQDGGSRYWNRRSSKRCHRVKVVTIPKLVWSDDGKDEDDCISENSVFHKTLTKKEITTT